MNTYHAPTPIAQPDPADVLAIAPPQPPTLATAYLWSAGSYLGAGLEPDNSCLLVIVGAREDGHKELLARELGYRESTESWASVLRGLRARGLSAPLTVMTLLLGGTRFVDRVSVPKPAEVSAA